MGSKEAIDYARVREIEASEVLTVSQFKAVEILVIVCNLTLAIGCAVATVWVCRWRRRLVALNLILELQVRDIDRILPAAVGQMGTAQQLIRQLQRIYRLQLNTWEQLQQIVLLLGIANNLLRKRRN